MLLVMRVKSPLPIDGRGCHVVTGEGENQLIASLSLAMTVKFKTVLIARHAHPNYLFSKIIFQADGEFFVSAKFFEFSDCTVFNLSYAFSGNPIL